MPDAFAAIDLGAESGRVVRGRFDGERVSLDVVHRFDNRPVRLPDGLRWNLLALFSEALEGLRRAAADGGALAGVGVDAWGVDYALLDGGAPRARPAVPLPRRPHRRDDRPRARARPARASSTPSPASRRCRSTRSSSCSPTRAAPALAAAEHIALVPDLFTLWLTGELANEATAASTTGLLDARTGGWARELIAPARAAGRAVRRRDDGAGHDDRPGARPPRGRSRGAPVHAVAGHDTASAFAAVPLRSGERAAVLSSGTWSLLGLELPAPVLDERAARVQPHERARHRRHDPAAAQRHGPVARAGVPARVGDAELRRAAPRWPPRPREDVAAVRPRRRRLPRPGRHARRGSRGVPRDAARSRRRAAARSSARSSSSLACKYRLVLERLERVNGPRGRRRPRHRRRRAGRAAVPADRRRARPPRPRRTGRGDRAGQRARAGARRRRARLARRHARRRRRVGRPDGLRARASAATPPSTPTSASSP